MSEQSVRSSTVTGPATARHPVWLNIGCGPVQPEGWVNIDGSNRARLASRLPWLDRLLVGLRLLPPTEFNRHTRSDDVRKGLPYPENSVEVVYCGEILEHFEREDGERFLAECFRVLKPGGVLRVRVPDNYHFWKNYVTEFERAYARPRREWDTEHARWTALFFRDICVRRPGLKSMGHYHKWMYDEITLTLAFEKAGFVEVERRGLHHSRIADVARVETRDDLIIEGVKPGAAGAPAAAD
jgi:predicted SAM-dependent methyltransferase